jgi:putative ABC transport system ATP-binding protein
LAESTVAVLRDVSKVYGRGATAVTAVHRVNLNIQAGEVIAIVGTSGAGKSTLLQILGCLDTPSSGQVLLDGRDVGQLLDREASHLRSQQIGFIFQDFHLVSTLTAAENVAIPLIYADVPRRQRPQLARAALARVGLDHRRGHLPRELSGGERQRVAVARALVNHPKLVLADEPTGNLDPKNADAVVQLLLSLKPDGVTTVLVTHSMAVAHVAERCITMTAGQVV